MPLFIARVAIEVDGPTHFLAHKDSTNRFIRNGSTKLRDRLLEARGWSVLSVPVVEWCGLATAKDRRSYLEDRLKRIDGPCIASDLAAASAATAGEPGTSQDRKERRQDSDLMSVAAIGEPGMKDVATMHSAAVSANGDDADKSTEGCAGSRKKTKKQKMEQVRPSSTSTFQTDPHSEFFSASMYGTYPAAANLL